MAILLYNTSGDVTGCACDVTQREGKRVFNLFYGVLGSGRKLGMLYSTVLRNENVVNCCKPCCCCCCTIKTSKLLLLLFSSILLSSSSSSL